MNGFAGTECADRTVTRPWRSGPSRVTGISQAKPHRKAFPGGRQVQGKTRLVDPVWDKLHRAPCGAGAQDLSVFLRNLPVTKPDQVWATDISYIPMQKGFVYFVAVVDWFSRRVPTWRVSISMEAEFCIQGWR